MEDKEDKEDKEEGQLKHLYRVAAGSHISRNRFHFQNKYHGELLFTLSKTIS